MRDKRKDLSYFNSYIEYQECRIKKKTAKLADNNGNSMKIEKINQSLLMYKSDMLYAQFSVGADKNELLLYLDDALQTASQLNTIDYETLLNLLSIAVMLEAKNSCMEVIEKHKELVQKDKLLNALAKYIESGRFVWMGKFLIGELYNILDNLVGEAEKESIMKIYLGNWYTAHKDFAWFDSHKNDKDTYVGYWSFESAALVKIIGMDEIKIKDKEYYPLL